MASAGAPWLRSAALAAAAMVALASAPTAAIAGTCVRTHFSFDRAASKLSTGAYVITFENPDDSAHPAVWQGPVRVAGASASCEASFDDIGLISAPLLLFDGAFLLLATADGSNSRLATLSLADCKVKASANLSGALAVSQGRITAGGRPVESAMCQGR